ncbi:TetR family transcriptional regulator [Jatrophihabitans sp. GAS493]|uniref:TetR/AcrR family transcriptional regulator n=1 Tax=Jatrophihabitans sp. GAS493 TaxID=1907575 RepID=UPI000BBFAD61|nr:TetR/AcrR family transcriptional regulator [Jatrophihabitans sp. GAS493]SOD72552.1 TetR family transcriptional regulator [Jatrophihabitans sp. GAS493]
MTKTSTTTANDVDHPSDVSGVSARERLLAAADELFYAEGVQSVGVERVLERAGVAKASLYNLFGNKQGLVLAYLQARHDGTTERLMAEVNRHKDPRRRILALFDVQAQVFAQPGFRGCAFISALAEAPLGGRVATAANNFRAWVRNLLSTLCVEAGAADPLELARQLHVIYDGGITAAWVDHDASIASSSRAAAEVILDAAL